MAKDNSYKFTAISNDIVDRIRNGEYLPGDKIPSENEIINRYSVSNTTARKALLDIELRGWAKRVKGKGTFVLNRTEDRHLLRTLRSEEHTSELRSLMRISYAVFCLKKKKCTQKDNIQIYII